MSFIDVIQYIVNGIVWFLAGMYTQTWWRRRKDKRND